MIDGSRNFCSHQLRNQLNGFQLEASLLIEESGESGEGVIRQLERVESLSRRLQQIATSLKSRVDPDFLEKVIRVLVVEDDGEQRRHLAQMLRKRGFFVATAPNGGAAIEYMYEQMSPDIVLMDLHMPECDGNEANRVIQFAPVASAARVIAVTATPSDKVSTSAFDGYVQKPVCMEKLEQMIRGLVEVSPRRLDGDVTTETTMAKPCSRT